MALRRTFGDRPPTSQVRGALGARASYRGGVHWYEVEIDGEAVSIQADTWKRDLERDAVVFVQRYRDPARPRQVFEHELLRVHLDRPHRHIRRL